MSSWDIVWFILIRFALMAYLMLDAGTITPAGCERLKEKALA